MSKVVSDEEKVALLEKGRYFEAILYPENLIEDWQEEISDLVQVPFCYCIHDKDLNKEKKEERKAHVHIVLAFSNTTTRRYAFTVFSKLQAEGKQAFAYGGIGGVQVISNIRHMYDYLIHDTNECRKKRKHLYSADERISGNNFDIGMYEQLSVVDEQQMRNEITNLIYEKQITNFLTLRLEIQNNYESKYEKVLTSHSSMFERCTKGMYQILVNKGEV